MRTLIAVPCMDTVHTLFMTSLLYLRRSYEDTRVSVCSNSLIYDARNILSAIAINGSYDRVLWLDSDMKFEPDLLERLSADLDAGADLVSGLFFTRKAPVVPCCYKALIEKNGIPTPVPFEDIPENQLFPVAGVGFGAVLMKTEMLKKVKENGGRPFTPLREWGEDISFCKRAREAGYTLYTDSRVKVGHVGISIIDESTYESFRR